ncbi:AIM24 family protein [Kineococcus rubinsiae]|uniref:AIM24 family protein n=1 Tax=Kineococcus rubinsiae TaxID=2609562 RepID=UPI00143210E9|nr:AIM24 family protein [Kineococcus rubinsiae]NIZ93315.1 AIM24 family protein [Kineococcus rubinsiae]
MSTQPLDPQTLPDHDNLPDNAYAYCVRLTGPLFMQTGRMIAYYPSGGGTIRFEPLTATSMTSMVASHFSSPLYSRDWVVANGQGHVILGDRGYDINSYDLDDGNLTVRAANLLAFDAGLELKESIIPGFLTLLGTGKFLASSSGPVIFVEPPVRVDPEALVGWADCPAPAQHFDAGWMGHFLGAARSAVLGARSGEERQYDFTGAGTVLLQSSERMLEDPHVVRRLEGEVRSLGVDQLTHLQGVISAQIQQHRQ